MRRRLSVFWVRADDLANFLGDFSQIMDLIEPSNTHVTTSQDRPLLARNVTARLEKDPSSWLLVLDNADDYHLFVGTAGGANAISSYLPREGRVLITTRDPRFHGTIAAARDGLKVKPMNRSEARDLFTKSIPSELVSESSPAIVDELLELLGNLPLALGQAAANIADQQRPVHEYIAAYRDKRNRPWLMEQPMLDLETEDSRTSRQSILVTYELSFEDLERDHQSSAHCLNYFGFFHWQRIPESCIRALPGLRDLDDQSFRNTIKRLFHLSLIENTSNCDGNEYSVHPVIHDRISDRLSLEEKKSYLSYSVAVILSKFPSHQLEKPHEYFDLCRHLQSHALLQIKFATEIDLKTEVLARLIRRCAKFLRRSCMTFDSVQLAIQAVEIGQEVWGLYSEPTIDAYIEKATCLNADARFREGYNESRSAMKILDSIEADIEFMGKYDHLLLRRYILEEKGRACRGLREFKEAEEIAHELVILRDGQPEDTENRIEDGGELVCTLIIQERFQEAQKMNNELLNSMNEQQRTAHRQTFLRVYHQKALILDGMRKGSDVEPAVVLANDEENAILRIFREVYNSGRATLPITDRNLWVYCNRLLEELNRKGKTPEAAEVLVNMLSEAVESRLRLEGRIIKDFDDFLHSGLSVIKALHGYGDARQIPLGLPIAELFVQMIALTDTALRRLWRRPHLFLGSSILSLRLGELHKAEELLREALQDNTLEENRD